MYTEVLGQKRAKPVSVKQATIYYAQNYAGIIGLGLSRNNFKYSKSI